MCTLRRAVITCTSTVAGFMPSGSPKKALRKLKGMNEKKKKEKKQFVTMTTKLLIKYKGMSR